MRSAANLAWVVWWSGGARVEVPGGPGGIWSIRREAVAEGADMTVEAGMGGAVAEEAAAAEVAAAEVAAVRRRRGRER